LAIATQRLANEARATELAQKEAELATIRATPAGTEPVELDPDLVGKLGDAFLVEDKAEATKILGEIVAKAQPATSAQEPAITQEQVNAAAERAVKANAAAAKYEENLNSGRETIAKDYGYLLADPALEAAVNAKAQEIFDGDNTKKPGDILVEAATAVNKSMIKAVGTPEKTEAELRLDRKRAASGKSVTTTGTKVASSPQKPAAQSNQSVVQKMVAERNLGLAGRQA
jgi:hypothetical protein